MSRSLFAVVGVALLSSAALAGEPAKGSGLNAKIAVPENLGFSANVSPDKQAATIFFDNLRVFVNPVTQALGQTQGQTAIQTKVATLNLPYETDQRSVKMQMDLRGYADVGPGAIARLVVCAGDTTKIVRLAAGQGKSAELKGKSKAEVAEEHPEAELCDWFERVEVTVQTHAAQSVLQITLFLAVEHDTDHAGDGSALLAVDSLDVEIVKSVKAACK